MLKQLHIWDKPNLAMVYRPSCVVLDPVDQHIVEHFVPVSVMVYRCLSLC